MNIKGWAFEPNGEKISDERRNRYKELRLNNEDDFEVLNLSKGLTINTYTLLVKNKDLTPTDMLIYCDSGNTCFGGYVDYSRTSECGNKIYKVGVYID